MNRIAAVVVLILVHVSGAWAVNPETVPVGDAGNAADTRYVTPGYGAVGYAYNVGKYEVTAGQYADFLNNVGGVDTYGLYNTEMSGTVWGSGITRSGDGTAGNPYTYSVATDYANRPVNYVSYWDSCRYANWLHNGQPTGTQGTGTTETGAYTLTTDGISNNTVTRNGNATWAITSEDEWYKAAYYKSGSITAGYWDYPTGSDALPGRDMADVSGNNANYDAGSGPYPIDSGMFTTLVGEFQNSDSPYGTFDQGGNLWEWNEAIFDANRGIRGGSFAFDYFGMRAVQGNSDPTTERNDFGFRVTFVPEPSSLLLLSIGGLTLLRRRRCC